MTLDRVKSSAALRYLPGFAAFFIPVLLLFIALQVVGVFPFGDRHVLVIDLFHQYAPFLAEYRRKLLSFDGVFFSWNGGLGVNFYSLFAYYLASPLNLLIVFFPPSQLSNFILFIVLLKVGLTGFTAYIYLRRGRSHTPKVALIFSIGYALSSFILAYFWNIMWLDVILLLPLLAYTLSLLVKFEKVWPYVLVLFFTLVTNYYAAFFAALFTGLYFFVLLTENSPLRVKVDYLAKTAIFAGASVLAAVMAAVLILPVYISLGHTSAAGSSWPDKFEWKYQGIDLIAQMLYGVEPHPRTGPPNIYAGVLILLLLPIYVLAKGIKTRVKVANVALLVFLFLSLNVNVLNLIWHGMHTPNQLPNRFAFVVVFLMMVMAADAYREIRSMGKWTVVKVAAAFIIGIFVLQKVDEDLMSFTTIVVSVGLLSIYAFLMVMLWKYPARMQRISSVLLVVVLIEFAGSTIMGAKKVPEGSSFGKIDGYAQGITPDETRTDVAKLKSEHPGEFFRMDYVFNKTVNDPMLYGMPGMTIFSSSVAEKPVKFLTSIGIPTNGINSFVYQSTLPTDTLLGMRYLLNRTDKQFRAGYPQIMSGVEVDVYDNENAFPVAFWVPKAAAQWQSPGESLLENQSSLFEALFGTQRMYEDVNFEAQAVNGDLTGPVMVPRGQQYNYTAPSGSSEDGYVNVSVTADQSGHYYFTYQRDTLRPDTVSVFTDFANDVKENQYTQKSGAIDLGYLQAGETAHVQLKFTEKRGKSGKIDLNVMRLDDYRYQMMLDAVASQDVEISNFDTGKFDATFTAPDAGYMLVTTTFDPGWSAEVNGVDTHVESLADGFVLVPVEAGQQTVSMSFKPEGFTKGLLVSIVGFLLFFALVWFEQKFPARRKTPVGVKSPQSAPDTSNDSNIVEAAAYESTSSESDSEDNGTDGSEREGSQR